MKVFREEEIFEDPEEQIIVSQKTILEEDEPLHKHEFIEMTYYLDGGAIHTINGHQFEVKKGDFLLLNANLAHAHKPLEYVSYIHILVKKDFMRQFILNDDNTLEVFFLSSLFEEMDHEVTPVISFRGTALLEAEELCSKMLKEYQVKADVYKTVLESYLKILLAVILRNVRSSDDKKWMRDMQKITPEMIHYLNNNFKENVTLQDFAGNSFYSPSYFNRMFKNCYGKNMKEYITEKRMQEAVSLLCTTNQPIDEIAVCVGYTNKNQFYKYFKEYTGVTPAQFRKSQK